MSNKDDFSAEEWKLLLDVPPAVGTAVMHAGKSGLGTAKESLAMVNSIMRADTQFSGELVRSLTEARCKNGERSEIETLGSPYAGQAPEDILRDTLKRCRQVVALLAKKVSEEEANEYVDWTLEVGENVAAAAKEGGFLGIGGERVSAEEKKAMSAIEKALLGD